MKLRNHRKGFVRLVELVLILVMIAIGFALLQHVLSVAGKILVLESIIANECGSMSWDFSAYTRRLCELRELYQELLFELLRLLRLVHAPFSAARQVSY